MMTELSIHMLMQLNLHQFQHDYLKVTKYRCNSTVQQYQQC